MDPTSNSHSVNNIERESDLREWFGVVDFELICSQFLPCSNDPPIVRPPQIPVVEAAPVVQAPRQRQAPRRLDLNKRARGKEMPNDERRAAYELLLKRSKNGVLKRKEKTNVAREFDVGPRTMQRLWKGAEDSEDNNYESKRGNCGRRKKEIDTERMKQLDFSERTTLESLAHGLGVSKNSLHRRLEDGTIRRHTNAVKPLLTPANHVTMIAHCLSSLDSYTLPHNSHFKNMYNTIHIDEKWFFLSKKHENTYLGRGEDDPVRRTKSTKFIGKVMFLAAVARPRYDSDGNCTFDGKIGIFPFIKYEATKHNSRNRPRGTMELKILDVVDRAVIRRFLIDKVLPAIASVWPLDTFNEAIFIQQDNCKTHIRTNDPFFLDAVEELGMNITLFCQPPNSPDMNILDLGFFRAIQSLQIKKRTRNLKELCDAVQHAFHVYPTSMCNRMFITLQSCMLEVMKSNGNNIYIIPHMKKNQLEAEGDLPVTLACPVELYLSLV